MLNVNTDPFAHIMSSLSMFCVFVIIDKLGLVFGSD